MNQILKSPNQLWVELFMARMNNPKQPLPVRPTVPHREVRLLRARLLLEETLETIQALGVKVEVHSPGDVMNGDPGHYEPVEMKAIRFELDGEPDLVEIADGCADIEVVMIGTQASCGIAHQPIYEEVCENNLLKFAPGHVIDPGGKLIKPPNHPKPAIRALLERQGMRSA